MRGSQEVWDGHAHTVYFRWVANKDLLCSTENSAQRYVAAWEGGALGGEWIDVLWMAEALCCPLRLSQHAPIQNKKLKNKTKGKEHMGKRVSVLVFSLLPYVIYFLIYPSNTLPRKKEKQLGGLRRNREGPGLALQFSVPGTASLMSNEGCARKGGQLYLQGHRYPMKGKPGCELTLCEPEVPWGPSSKELHFHFQVTLTSSSGPVLPRS